MSYRINSYENNPRALRDALLTAEDLDAGEVAAAAIALCGMVDKLELLALKVAKLEAAEVENQRVANVISMLANGIKPD